MQEIENSKLELKFDLNTIEHLGIQMYKTLPPVLAELVSNAYDADASWVDIRFSDNQNEKQIIVTDNGNGMSFEEIKDSFLVIGKNRRKNEKDGNLSPKGRKVTGRKGLGKLAIFGIAAEIKIQTIKAGLKNIFIMNIEKILTSSSGAYQPEVICKNEPTQEDSGTQLTLSKIKRTKSFDIDEIRESLSKRFAFSDDDFSIILTNPPEHPLFIKNDTKWDYVDCQLSWDFSVENDSFTKEHNISGKIITTKKPLKEEQRGIFLYARGKLVNPNEFYGIKATSSLAYNYMTGIFYVDYIDELEKDFVTTNRDGLTWERDELEPLKIWLGQKIQFVEKQWNLGRKKTKEEEILKVTGVDLNSWTKTMPVAFQNKVTNIVTRVIQKEEIDKEITNSIVNELYALVPQYPIYHWRELHPEVKDASEVYYKNQDYYNAFLEASKRYKNAVKLKSKVADDTDYKIMVNSFGKDKKLRVTRKYEIRPNGEKFGQTTLDNIEEGQMNFSQGVVTGGRNVLSHEEHKDLRQTGLFSEKDCLDLLSLLSHLFERLDDA